MNLPLKLLINKQSYSGILLIANIFTEIVYLDAPRSHSEANCL